MSEAEVTTRETKRVKLIKSKIMKFFPDITYSGQWQIDSVRLEDQEVSIQVSRKVS